MMKIGPKRALMHRASAAPSFSSGLGGSLLRSLWASHNTPATPATCSSPVMHMAFARLFSTNLSSGAAVFTPFSVGVPSSMPHTSHIHPQHVGVPQTTPVGQMDAATNSLSEHHLDNFEISAPIKAALRQNFKIESLFPVQAECYGPIVEGKDLIGRSKTGTHTHTHMHREMISSMPALRLFLLSPFCPSPLLSLWFPFRPSL